MKIYVMKIYLNETYYGCKFLVSLQYRAYSSRVFCLLVHKHYILESLH